MIGASGAHKVASQINKSRARAAGPGVLGRPALTRDNLKRPGSNIQSYSSKMLCVGDVVEGLWPPNGRWYPAKIAQIRVDSYSVEWKDGSTEHTTLSLQQVRPVIEDWARCDKCHQWRSILDKSKYENSKKFTCSNLYDSGCSEITEDYWAFPKKSKSSNHSINSESQESQLITLRDSYEYLLDRLPRYGSCETVSKDELLDGVENARSADLLDGLLLIQGERAGIRRWARRDGGALVRHSRRAARRIRRRARRGGGALVRHSGAA